MACEISRKAFLALAAPAAACATLPRAAQPDWISDFVDLLYRRKDVRTAFERHVAEDYIQHSAGMASGREAAIVALMPMFARANFLITPIRVIVDGDFAIVFLHVAVGESVQALVIDIFRFEGQAFVEHWDIKRELSPSEAADFFTRLGK